MIPNIKILYFVYHLLFGRCMLLYLIQWTSHQAYKHYISRKYRTFLDLGHLYPKLPAVMRRGAVSICIAHIRLRKDVLDRSDLTAPARHRELDHTDQESIYLPCTI